MSNPKRTNSKYRSLRKKTKKQNKKFQAPIMKGGAAILESTQHTGTNTKKYTFDFTQIKNITFVIGSSYYDLLRIVDVEPQNINLAEIYGRSVVIPDIGVVAPVYTREQVNTYLSSLGGQVVQSQIDDEYRDTQFTFTPDKKKQNCILNLREYDVSLF